MKIIKSAIVFKAHLPAADQLETHLLEMPFAPLGEAQFSRTSFVINYSTGRLVTPIAGGYSITVRYDEKIMPKASVSAAQEAAIEAQEEAIGRRLDTDEANAIRESVYHELLKTALTRTTVVNAFYNTDERLLMIQASKALAQTVVAALISVVGSIKTETIHISDIKHGLATRLRNHILTIGDEDFNAFSPFKLGQSVNLKLKSDKLNLSMQDIDDARRGIEEALDHGFLVERIELIHETMAFKLTKDFHFKGIDFFGQMTEDDEMQRADLGLDALWALEAGVQVMQLTAAIVALCKIMDYHSAFDTDEQQPDMIGDAE